MAIQAFAAYQNDYERKCRKLEAWIAILNDKPQAAELKSALNEMLTLLQNYQATDKNSWTFKINILNALLLMIGGPIHKPSNMQSKFPHRNFDTEFFKRYELPVWTISISAGLILNAIPIVLAVTIAPEIALALILTVLISAFAIPMSISSIYSKDAYYPSIKEYLTNFLTSANAKHEIAVQFDNITQEHTNVCYSYKSCCFFATKTVPEGDTHTNVNTQHVSKSLPQ